VNRQSYTRIACASPADAARLAALLGQAAQWSGQVRPDLVEANGSEVDLTWFSAPAVLATAVSSAVSLAKGSAGNIGSVGITHSNSGSGGSVTTLPRQ